MVGWEGDTRVYSYSLRVRLSSTVIILAKIDITSFLSLLYEEPIRPFILNQLKSYLINNEIELNSIIGVTISNIIEISKLTLNEKRSLLLLTDLISELNNIIYHHSSILKSIFIICRSISSSINLILPEKSYNNYLISCLDFFAFTSNEFFLNNNEISSLLNIMNELFRNNLEKSLYDCLLNILSGGSTNFSSPTFIIKQPNFLVLIFDFYKNTSNLLIFLEFINNLCNYSTSNCIECHKGRLDVIILEFLNENWYENELENSYLDISLSILFKISIIQSSSEVVHKFLKLLSPNNDKIPKYFLEVITTLNMIVSSSIKDPQTSIIYNEFSEILTDFEFKIIKGFTFITWLYIPLNQKNNNLPLIALFDNENNIVFQISLNHGRIHSLLFSKKSESTSKTNFTLKFDEWSFLSSSLSIESNNTLLTISINGKDFEQFNFPSFSIQENYKLIFGDKNIFKINPQILIGVILLFENNEY